MYEIILMIHVAIAASLIVMVLIQKGKGGMGALGGSGGGGSQTLFGSQGSGNFFTRVTAILATCFFITSLTLSGIAVQRGKATRAAELPVAPVQRQIAPAEPTPAQDVPVIPQ